MSESTLLDSVVDAISDGVEVDWAVAEGLARTADERALLSQLKAIDALTASKPSKAAADDETRNHRLALTYGVLVALAAGKVLLGVVAWLLDRVGVAEQPAHWPYIANVTVFGLGGAFLWWGGRDWRARSLGAFYLFIAAAFSDRLLSGLSALGDFDQIVHALRRLTVDAWIPFGLWLFVWFFPAPPLGPRDRSLTRFFLGVSLIVGVTLLGANGILWLAELLPPAPLDAPDSQPHGLLVTLAAFAAPFDRQTSGSLFSLLQFLPAVPALPHLLWKSRFEALEERRRVTLFAILLVVGIGPMILAVLLSPLLPFFQNPANRALIGTFLYAALLSVVPLTAHAVLVQRVMNVELFITNAMRHAIVRHAAGLAAVLPLLAFVVYVYSNRELTVTQIVWTPATTFFLPGTLIALAIVVFRRQLLQAIDRRFLIAPLAYPEILRRLERGLREARGVREVGEVLAREADRAVHPAMVAMLVPDESGGALASLDGSIPPLPVDSALGELLHLAHDEIYTGVEASGPVGRLLPEHERQWLRDTGIRLLVPMLGSTRELLGVIVVGDKRNAQRFSQDERLLLATMAGQATVVLENHALRDRTFQHLVTRQSTRGGTIHWDDEPAALCGQCQRMWPTRTTICTCGHPTAPAALPISIRGTFRVERLLGTGGMCVVYLATDLTLDRKVAIKTLPRLTPDRSLRLQREARAMAAVRHPNLAMIFGVESWRGAPLLITEYLDGGTLADRLRRERLGWADTVELGIVLADVLDQVHASGVLHRDIKPTNVGFTSAGVPKLLDFGIALMGQPDATGPDAAPPPQSGGHRAREAPAQIAPAAMPLTHADHLIGTPLYVSPEALAGMTPSPSFDLWGLSVLLFEALAGENPFAAPTIAQVFDRIQHAPVDIRDYRADCPPDLVAFFVRAFDHDAARRPATAAELRNCLRQLRPGSRSE